MELLIKETLEKLLDILKVSYTGVKITKEKENVFYVEIETENSNTESIVEKQLLKNVCHKAPNDYELINNLLTLQHSKTLLLSNYRLQNDLEKRIEEFVKTELSNEN